MNDADAARQRRLQLATGSLDQGVRDLRLRLSAGRLSIPDAAASISQLVAAINAPNPFGEGGAAVIDRAIRETQGPYLPHIDSSVIVGALQDQLAAAVRSAALVAVQNFSDQMIEIAHAFEERWPAADWNSFETALWEMGWWVPPSLPFEFLWRVGALAAAGNRTAVRQSLVSVGRSRAMFEYVEGWMHLDPFKKRRRFILDGLRDHRDGRYRVSIPTLLPQIEGIAYEVFAPGSADTGMRSILARAAGDYDNTLGPALVQTVTMLWDHRDFSVIAPTSRQINRHLVLHGRSTGYGTEENSIKVLFALDLLASVLATGARHAAYRASPV